ncbi:unnamed protein product [Eretmochelys imbricata]
MEKKKNFWSRKKNLCNGYFQKVQAIFLFCSTENMDFPKLVLDDKILMDILVLALMLIAIGIAFLIYHRTENIEQSKLLLAEIILLTTAVISLFALIIIGTIFLTYHCSDSPHTSPEHLDMPKLVLMFSILLAVVTVSFFILIPFLIYYRCCSENRKRDAAKGNTGDRLM